MQPTASPHTDEFPALLACLPPDLDLDQLAIEHKAIQRGRKIRTGTELLRLALAHGPGGMSLRDAAGWAGMHIKDAPHPVQDANIILRDHLSLGG